MEQQTQLHSLELLEGKNQFTDGIITITVNGFYYHDGKNHIDDPQTAKAQFDCNDERYTFQNTVGVTNVEDWYNWELLPKLQMLRLLSPQVFV